MVSLADALGLVGVLIGIIGVIVGVAYGRAHGRPVFKQSGNRVVTASPDKRITVQYAGDDVPRVTRTRIAIWNAGRRPLNSSDIADDYPIRFRFGGEQVRVLDVATLRTSDEANKFRAIRDDGNSAVLISIDYLEHRQGGVIEVTHTSDGWGATASGKIKGVPRGIREARLPKPPSSPVQAFLAVIVIIPLFIVVVALFELPLLFIWDVLENLLLQIVLTGIIALIAAALVVAVVQRYREPRALSLSDK
jgi:hypothetical protein